MFRSVSLVLYFGLNRNRDLHALLLSRLGDLWLTKDQDWSTAASKAPKMQLLFLAFFLVGRYHLTRLDIDVAPPPGESLQRVRPVSPQMTPGPLQPSTSANISFSRVLSRSLALCRDLDVFRAACSSAVLFTHAQLRT